jgi:hypothetical protein
MGGIYNLFKKITFTRMQVLTGQAKSKSDFVFRWSKRT